MQSESPSASELNKLGLYLLVCLGFVVAALFEFALVIFISRISKKTNKPKKKEWVEDYFLQLVAYAEAHNEVYGTDIKEGHVFMCSRKLDYQQFDITPTTYNHYKKEWWNRVEEYYIKHAV